MMLFSMARPSDGTPDTAGTTSQPARHAHVVRQVCAVCLYVACPALSGVRECSKPLRDSVSLKMGLNGLAAHLGRARAEDMPVVLCSFATCRWGRREEMSTEVERLRATILGTRRGTATGVVFLCCFVADVVCSPLASAPSAVVVPPAAAVQPVPEMDLSIWAVMSTPALKEAFRWFNVTVYCPENLMFIDKIDFAWRPVADRQCDNADDEHARIQDMHGVANFIVQTYLLDESPWEVSLPSTEKVRLRNVVARTPEDQPLPSTLFDDGYDHVMRDMARSLTSFQQTDVFRSYVTFSTLIESLYSRYSSASGRAEGAEGGAESERATGELLARIRHLYHTTQPLRMVLDENDSLRYLCYVGNDLRGFAIMVGETFHFHDAQGKALVVVPRTVLSNVKSRAAQLSSSSANNNDDKSNAAAVTKGGGSGARTPGSGARTPGSGSRTPSGGIRSPASGARSPASRGSPAGSPRKLSREEKRAAFALSRNKSLTSVKTAISADWVGSGSGDASDEVRSNLCE